MIDDVIGMNEEAHRKRNRVETVASLFQRRSSVVQINREDNAEKVLAVKENEL